MFCIRWVFLEDAKDPLHLAGKGVVGLDGTSTSLRVWLGPVLDVLFHLEDTGLEIGISDLLW